MDGNVFISWSGDRSKQVGELLKRWLPTVLQRCVPWISTDLDRGTLWFQEVSGQLAESGVGIICLTRENLNAPWILFEAGALAKGLSQNRVCPLLIDLQSAEISPPLSQFNHTQATKADMMKLVDTLNRTLSGPALPEETLHTVFERMWPDFEGPFQEILGSTPSMPAPERTPDQLLSDVYESVQRLEKLAYLTATTSNFRAASNGSHSWMKEPATMGEVASLLYHVYLNWNRLQSLEKPAPPNDPGDPEAEDGPYCGDRANNPERSSP